jgi:single-stranded-DNA-specific exonuclease
MNTKVVGVSFEGRQEIVRTLKQSQELFLMREPDNDHDSNAVAVLTNTGEQVGYLSKTMAEDLAPAMDKGNNYNVKITTITGGEDQHLGVNIEILHEDEEDADEKYNVVPVGVQ